MKILTFLLLFSLPVLAQDFTFNKEKGEAVPNYVCQLKVMRGKVFQVTGGVKKEVKVGTRFYQNDTLITQDKSFAQLLIADDSVMSIGANSEINFAEFKFIDKTNRQIVYSFIKGQIRALIKNKAKEGDIIFKTKLAIMGVRGTELFINHQTIKKIEVSEFALTEGNVQVADDKNQKHEVNKSDRLIIVQDSETKKSAIEMNTLSNEELKILSKEDELLHLFNPASLIMTSSLLPYFHANEAPAVVGSNNESAASEPTEKEVQNKDWRGNLKKLNKKLKDYQEK